MKSIAAVSRVKVSADDHGVVSHAGLGMLPELAELTGLSAQVTAALADTYRGPWIYEPGAVFADLAAAVATKALLSLPECAQTARAISGTTDADHRGPRTCMATMPGGPTGPG